MQETSRKSLGMKCLDWIEKTGNRLPNPVAIFMILCALILIASWIAAALNVSAVNPSNGETVRAINLLSGPNIVRALSEGVKNFSSFAPLGLVLVVMLGVGVAEKSGWFEVAMKRIIAMTPHQWVIPIIILVGINGNLAGDAAIIILPPIAAMVFLRLGFHPVAGIVCAYASVIGAFAANMTISMGDILLLSFTSPAADLIQKDIELNPAMNYYFLLASTFLLLPLTWWLTIKVTIPRMGQYEALHHEQEDVSETITPKEHRAMLYANYTLLALVVLLCLLMLPQDSLLRNPESHSLIHNSPLMKSLILIITILFFIPAVVYGVAVGSIRNSNDLARMMTESISSMGGYIVIVFFAAQMLAYFNWSNLGIIIAIKGAEALAEQNGVLLIVGIILFSSTINLFIGSASAKWGILAPIFVPMMMLLGYHPAFTQMIYRIGDSITNPITPMMPYMPLILTMAQRYIPNMGLGTFIALALPYTLAFTIAWTLLIVAWYLLGWPVGVAGPIHL